MLAFDERDTFSSARRLDGGPLATGPSAKNYHIEPDHVSIVTEDAFDAQWPRFADSHTPGLPW